MSTSRSEQADLNCFSLCGCTENKSYVWVDDLNFPGKGVCVIASVITTVILESTFTALLFLHPLASRIIASLPSLEALSLLEKIFSSSAFLLISSIKGSIFRSCGMGQDHALVSLHLYNPKTLRGSTMQPWERSVAYLQRCLLQLYHSRLEAWFFFDRGWEVCVRTSIVSRMREFKVYDRWKLGLPIPATYKPPEYS